MHETTSEHTDRILDFLEEQSRHLQVSAWVALNHFPSCPGTFEQVFASRLP